MVGEYWILLYRYDSNCSKANDNMKKFYIFKYFVESVPYESKIPYLTILTGDFIEWATAKSVPSTSTWMDLKGKLRRWDPVPQRGII